MMSSIDEAMELFFNQTDSISGANGLMTWGQAEEAEELPSDIENAPFYTNTAIKRSLIPVWNQYGFSSVKHPNINFQETERKSCIINTTLQSHHNHLIYFNACLFQSLYIPFRQQNLSLGTKLLKASSLLFCEHSLQLKTYTGFTFMNQNMACGNSETWLVRNASCFCCYCVRGSGF